jgi:hypothetical protein
MTLKFLFLISSTKKTVDLFKKKIEIKMNFLLIVICLCIIQVIFNIN